MDVTLTRGQCYIWVTHFKSYFSKDIFLQLQTWVKYLYTHRWLLHKVINWIKSSDTGTCHTLFPNLVKWPTCYYIICICSDIYRNLVYNTITWCISIQILNAGRGTVKIVSPQWSMSKSWLCPKRIRLKKKILCLKACENFSNRCGMRFFIFHFIYLFLLQFGLCLHAHPKPKMTEKFQRPYFQKSNGILHVFWAPTCLNSSKTAKFLRFS